VAITGDRTTIDVTSIGFLNFVGIGVSGLGSAIVFSSPPAQLLFAVLPVTGGNVNLPFDFVGTIEHAGSGLRLSFGGVDADLTNFTINTGSNILTGDVKSGAFEVAGATLFDILACSSGAPGTCQTNPNAAVIPTGIGLRISSDLATGLAVLLGLPDLTGFQFGVANTALTAVPEPGTALLVGSALAGLAALRRDRRA